MSEGYRLACVDDPDDSAATAVGMGIRDYNERRGGKDGYRRLCCFLYAPDDEAVGGLVGATFWRWLHIDLLWVKEELRGRGFGRRLLSMAEEEARRRGATDAFLDTFSFQAPEFYRRNGYEPFGELHDFPQGHSRIFLTKRL